jgi:(p)ppGpp synthase/HD superfamily hydrolase
MVEQLSKELHETCLDSNMEKILERIITFADKAHGSQRRKYADEKYIEHPVRVMNTCRSYNYPLPVLAAALLHDVLEDTDTTPHEIKDFLLTVMDEEQAFQALHLVIELTDVYIKSQYPRLNRQRRKSREAARMEKISAEAQTIKYADILDNSKEIVQHDPDFAPVFLRECCKLIDKMDKGNQQLREEALAVLKREIERLRTPDFYS